jgi:plasmid stability protein
MSAAFKLPPEIAAAVRRILDAEARRILTARLDGEEEESA